MGLRVECWLSLLAAGITVAAGIHAPFTDCGSDGSLINFVDLEPCSKLPCVFKVGTNIIFDVNFNATKAASSPKTKAYMFMHGFYRPLKDVPEDACSESVKCPIKADSPPQDFSISLEVKEKRRTRGVIIWEISDDSREPLFCAMVPFVIVPDGTDHS